MLLLPDEKAVGRGHSRRHDTHGFTHGVSALVGYNQTPCVKKHSTTTTTTTISQGTKAQQSDIGLLTELSNPAIFSSSSFLTFPMSLLPIGSCFLVHQRKNSWLPERREEEGRKSRRKKEAALGRERERGFFYSAKLSPLSPRESGRIKYGRLSISFQFPT